MVNFIGDCACPLSLSGARKESLIFGDEGVDVARAGERAMFTGVPATASDVVSISVSIVVLIVRCAWRLFRGQSGDGEKCHDEQRDLPSGPLFARCVRLGDSDFVVLSQEWFC